MKKLLYLGIVLMFASCGSDELESSASNESESSANESESTTSTVNVDGKDFSTIKIGNLEVMTEDLIGNLEVMTEDLGEMNWGEAKKACENLGNGWRLPTKDELNVLYENKDKMGGFAINGYWSFNEVDMGFETVIQTFNNGHQRNPNEYATAYVRAVRDF